MSAPFPSRPNQCAPANAASTATNYTVAARTPYSRQWVKILSQTNADGSVTLQTNSAYTELGSGLCYTNAFGQLVDADETINIVADGAECHSNPT